MTSPYMNISECASYLRCLRPDGSLNLQQARDYLSKERIPVKKRGHALLVRREDVEASLKLRRSA